MRAKLLLTLTLLLGAITTWAQAPNLMNYQAVVRDNSGAPVINIPR